MAYKDLNIIMRYISVVIMLFIAVYSKGQINVIEVKSKSTSKPYLALYDSLTNIMKMNDDSVNQHQSFKHLVGQTIYYLEPDTTKYRVHHKSFYSTPEIVYRTQPLPRHSCMSIYWKITDIVTHKSRYGGSDREIFELTDTTNGRKVYCEPKGFIPDMNRDFVVLGYYEKMKKQYVGKSFIYRKYYSYGIADSYDGYQKYNNLINFETKKVGDSIPINSIWKCVDVGVYNITQHDKSGNGDDRCPIILIFENNKLGKYYSYTQDYLGRPFQETEYCFWPQNKGHEEERLPLYLGKFIDQEQQVYIEKKENETKQYFANQKKRMIAKYGKYWGKLVAEGQLEIGMTKQMCRDSWGEPESINRTSTRYGNHEQWVYSTIFVYFDNGKISAIQDR